MPLREGFDESGVVAFSVDCIMFISINNGYLNII